MADAAAVTTLAGAAPGAIARLVALGLRFDRDGSGRLALAREAAHSRARIVHAADATGEELVRALVAPVGNAPHVAVRPRTFARDLVVEKGRAVGVLAVGGDGATEFHPARAVVVATGGIGHIFAATTNPPEATGDGLAMAARAAVELADLEFVQFHPTALSVEADPLPLLTEALRGAGARFVDGGGAQLTLADGSPCELAPRDVVSALIAETLASGEPVFLDARPIGRARLSREFPAAFAQCLAAGYDPGSDLLPVQPAAHYHMGGIATDLNGRSSLRGLWACGEAACTGVHGANRLASNSLLEGLVFGAIVARDLRDVLGAPAFETNRDEADRGGGAADDEAAWTPPPRDAARLRRAVSRGLSVTRTAAGLEAVLETAAEIRPDERGELMNMALVARLVAAAALARRESRGAHRRADFPGSDPGRAARRRTTAEALLAETTHAPLR